MCVNRAEKKRLVDLAKAQAEEADARLAAEQREQQRVDEMAKLLAVDLESPDQVRLRSTRSSAATPAPPGCLALCVTATRAYTMGAQVEVAMRNEWPYIRISWFTNSDEETKAIKRLFLTHFVGLTDLYKHYSGSSRCGAAARQCGSSSGAPPCHTHLTPCCAASPAAPGAWRA